MERAASGLKLVDLVCLGLQWSRGKYAAGSMLGLGPVIG